MKKTTKERYPRYPRSGRRQESDSYDAVPMLRYGAKCNLPIFKQKLVAEAMVRYGDLAKMLETDQYYEPPRPDTRDVNPRTDPIGYKEIEDQCIRRSRAIGEMAKNRTPLYGFMIQHLSNESHDAIKLLDEYQEFNATKDPLSLWLAIKKTHKVATSSNVGAVMKAETRRKYQEVRQGTFESIVTYKEKFDYLLEAYKEMDNAKMSDTDVAMDFFNGLDETRYGDFKTNYLNDLTMGTQIAPTHINDIYNKVSKYLPARKQTRAAGGAAFVTKAERKTTSKGKHSTSDSDENDDKESKRGQKNPRHREQRRKPLICWGCGEPGHRLNECPDNQDADERNCAVTLKNAFTSGGHPFRWYEVLLDNQADVSVVHPALLHNIRPATRKCTVAGLSGHAMELPNVGDLDQFFPCTTADHLRASVLCQSDVEDMYDVTYVQGKSYTVHLPGRDLVFARRNKMYVADMRDWATGNVHVTTVADMEARHSKAEVARAREAWDLVKTSGFDSEKDAINLVSDGNITGLKLTASDVRRAFEIYGIPYESVRGKHTHKKTGRQYVDTALKSEMQREQRLYSDIFSVRQQSFLLTMAEPLGVSVVSAIQNETTEALGLALQEHVNLLRSYGYVPTIAYLDPQPGFKPLRGQITGVEIDVAGAGDHLDKIDSKIRRLKEMIRSIHAGLPWDLPDANVKDLVRYANSRMNLRRPSTNGSTVAPRVALTGIKPNFKKELALAFGDYVECYDPKVKSNDAEQDRTEPCIALYPAGNANGSWIFLNLKTNRYVSRTNWRKMITTQLVIDAVNKTAQENRKNARHSPAIADQPDQCGEAQDDTAEGGNATATTEHESNNTEMSEDAPATNNSESVGQMGEEESPTTTGSDAPNEINTEDITGVVHNTMSSPSLTEGRRAAGAIRKPVMYRAYHTSITQGLKEHGKDAYLAIVRELKQLLHDKKAIAPVHRSELSTTQIKRAIRSLMFLKTKYDGLGRFEKIKARLVANGAQQDKKLYTDTSSPTVAMQSVFACLAIAAKERRHISTVDIGGAYLNAEMTGEEVIMELEPMLAAILKKMDPAVQPYIDERGRLLVRLDRALYGCVQSARLWYNTLRTYLESIGFAVNPVDQCVFNRTVNGKQCTVTLHVDDLLVMSQCKEDTEWLVAKLKQQYGEVKHCTDHDMSYIGMHINVQDGKAVVSMRAYLEGVLEETGTTGGTASPATASLFIEKSEQKLGKRDAAEFHTVVAKLLYLATRVRPDILLSIAYLATRVKDPTQDDKQKLGRVLKYLAATKNQDLHLRIGDKIQVKSYIDASFATHQDGKGHTGVVVSVGDAAVLCRSTKQKLVTKDSTESELVALSDMLPCVMKLHEFLCGQGCIMDSPTIFQDNASTLSLVTKGGGKYRSKYLRVRQALVKEHHDRGDVKLQYLPTGEMLADVLTKPLQGKLFRHLICLIVGNE